MPMRMYVIGYVYALVRAPGSTNIQSFKLLKAQIIINSDNETSQTEQYKKIPTTLRCFTK